MLKEFREFINRGNVIELAVAVVLGTAFNQIVTAFVADVLTPLIGILMGGINLGGLFLQIGSARINYGNVIQATINFVLTAFALFLIVKAYNRFRRKEEKKEEATPSEEVVLLTEIRDLLRQNRAPVAAAQPSSNASQAASVPNQRNPDKFRE